MYLMLSLWCLITGALQMIFLLYASDSSGPVDAAARMGLQQFKSMLQAAKVTSTSVPPEKVDEVYTMLQTSPGALSRSVQHSRHFGGHIQNCSRAGFVRPTSSGQVEQPQQAAAAAGRV
jgi:hypothetical protein